MGTYLYHLEFNAPVHFGATGIGLENSRHALTSDALTSALLNAFNVLGMADDAVQGLMREKPSFVLSSLFPYGPKQKESRVHIVPRPLCRPCSDNEVLRRIGKEIKKINYIDIRDLSAWLGDKLLGEEDIIAIKERGGSFHGDWYETELRPRVALDRNSNNSSIWHCGVVHFRDGAGLYGLAHISDTAWKKKLEAGFNLLGELGLGGERTYGMGTFRFLGFEPAPPAWIEGVNHGKYVLLSSYYPTTEERERIGETFAAWGFHEIRGYIVSGRNATTIKRKHVRMLSAGSIATHPVIGRLADVTPDGAGMLGLTHKVYRSGLAFLFPWEAI